MSQSETLLPIKFLLSLLKVKKETPSYNCVEEVCSLICLGLVFYHYFKSSTPSPKPSIENSSLTRRMISCTSPSPNFVFNCSKNQFFASNQFRRRDIIRLKLPRRLSVHSFARPSRRACTSESVSSVVEDEWLQKLPDKKKPLYSHSLPSIEAWLKNLGFFQSKEDRAVWRIERLDWHAQLSLDITDLFIRYLKSGPGNLERDVERKFSYALSREDVENAILGGP